MSVKSVAEVKERYAKVDFKPNAKSMTDMVDYIENTWKGERVKIKESLYVFHYKEAIAYRKSLGLSVEGMQEDIRRYKLPNNIHIIVGMETEYFVAEDGLKYYQTLTMLKGLTAEDIETKNDRWLQYILMLAIQEDWDARDAALKAAEEAEEAEGGGAIMGKFYSGFVSLIGRPNVGKSTLMNCLVGEKIAITSSKPQTTRNKITSILTKDDFQCVFLDTPGIHRPKHKLGEFMVRSAQNTFNEVDLVLMLIEPTEKIGDLDQYVIDQLESVKTPVVLVINKIDTVEPARLLEIMKVYSEAYSFKEIVPISAIKARNTDHLMDVIKANLPEGPQYFPADMLTDQPERQLAAEIIREKALYLLQEEIPHGIAVEIMSMKKRPQQEMVDVEATLYCEKESHKGIIIGKQGTMLKKIGTQARRDMERLMGSRINLQIWIKVKKDWRDSDFLLKNFGYDKRNL